MAVSVSHTVSPVIELWPRPEGLHGAMFEEKQGRGMSRDGVIVGWEESLLEFSARFSR